MSTSKEDSALITALHRDFKYDPTTGELRHRRARQKITVGSRAGSVTRFGYRAIGWNGYVYREHRIIFAMMTGRWPTHQIDHANNIRDDNRWCNLREATNAQNQRNSIYRNKTGLKGAYPSSGKWDALISVKGKLRYLGRYSTPEEAHAVYAAAAKEVAGDFARSEPAYLD